MSRGKVVKKRQKTHLVEIELFFFNNSIILLSTLYNSVHR